jgi:hypothetical protein
MQENSPLLRWNSEVLRDPAAIASKLTTFHVADVVDPLNARTPAVAAAGKMGQTSLRRRCRKR